MENKPDIFKTRKPIRITEEKKEMLVKILPLYEDMQAKGVMFNEDMEYMEKGIGYEDHIKLDKAVMSWYRTGNDFFPTKVPNQDSIPAGLYDIHDSYELGLYITRRVVILDELFMLPDEAMTEVVTDMVKFWERKEKYREYGVTYKRGILLYGPPGTGKTSLNNLIINKIIKDYQGIVLNVESLRTFIPMARIIRDLEPVRPILAIIDDLDDFIYNNSTKDFLNVLDGNMTVDNICYLGNTNYIDRMEPRFLRSSRFDRKIEIGYPNEIARKTYFTKKLKPNDYAQINIDKWVRDTNGFSIADMKELIISVCVLDLPYEETLKMLKYNANKYNRD